jgi:hypothetical protein
MSDVNQENLVELAERGAELAFWRELQGLPDGAETESQLIQVLHLPNVSADIAFSAIGRLGVMPGDGNAESLQAMLLTAANGRTSDLRITAIHLIYYRFGQAAKDGFVKLVDQRKTDVQDNAWRALAALGEGALWERAFHDLSHDLESVREPSRIRGALCVYLARFAESEDRGRRLWDLVVGNWGALSRQHQWWVSVWPSLAEIPQPPVAGPGPDTAGIQEQLRNFVRMDLPPRDAPVPDSSRSADGEEESQKNWLSQDRTLAGIVHDYRVAGWFDSFGDRSDTEVAAALVAESDEDFDGASANVDEAILALDQERSYWLDTKTDSPDYAEVLWRLVQISGGALAVTDIDEEFGDDGSQLVRSILRFTLKGHPHALMLDAGRFVDPRLIVEMNSLMEGDSAFYTLDTGGSRIVITRATNKEAVALMGARGIRLTRGVPDWWLQLGHLT